jgi:hypothetical protein
MDIRYQNATNGWPLMLGAMLGADAALVAWSGVGVCQNAVEQQGSVTLSLCTTVHPPSYHIH